MCVAYAFVNQGKDFVANACEGFQHASWMERSRSLGDLRNLNLRLCSSTQQWILLHVLLGQNQDLLHLKPTLPCPLAQACAERSRRDQDAFSWRAKYVLLMPWVAWQAQHFLQQGPLGNACGGGGRRNRERAVVLQAPREGSVVLRLTLIC